MNFIKTKKLLSSLLIIVTLLISPNIVWAKGGFEFYFLGVNLKTFRQSHWMKLAIGAVASVLTHELGHVLYLESQGKDWEFNASFPSGFAISTPDSLSDEQYRGFGRSGFLLQSSIGILLTAFEGTRDSDFTKGWTGMNAFQTSSYPWRRHDFGDDFAMIDRGHGAGDTEFVLFSFLSTYNFSRACMPTFKQSCYIEGSYDSLSRPVLRDPGIVLKYDWHESGVPMGLEIVPRPTSNFLAEDMIGFCYSSTGFRSVFSMRLLQ
jgi:hypothetical protein